MLIDRSGGGGVGRRLRASTRERRQGRSRGNEERVGREGEVEGGVVVDWRRRAMCIVKSGPRGDRPTGWMTFSVSQSASRACSQLQATTAAAATVRASSSSSSSSVILLAAVVSAARRIAVAAPTQRRLCHRPPDCSQPVVVKTTTTPVAMTTQVSTSVLAFVTYEYVMITRVVMRCRWIALMWVNGEISHSQRP